MTQVGCFTPFGVTTLGTSCGHFHNYGVYYGQGIIRVTGPRRVVIIELIQLKVGQVSRRGRRVCLITNGTTYGLLTTTKTTHRGTICIGTNYFIRGLAHHTHNARIVTTRGSTMYGTGLGGRLFFYVIYCGYSVRGGPLFRDWGAGCVACCWAIDGGVVSRGALYFGGFTRVCATSMNVFHFFNGVHRLDEIPISYTKTSSILFRW